ncbi:hypothetical protein EYC84_011675 [Monilinia fructicola]|uniref:Cytochrome P450 monooxygenase n=1 Tax=Monilinia fructicola TaxID=38448 RepID=A0A5M9J668_MONFR|nr:hypothetical protein EYC84_011675 [Monilinia fructicola]
MSFAGILPASKEIAVLAVSLFTFYYAVFAIYNLYFSPLSKFPGPKRLAISRLPLIRYVILGTTYKYFDRLHEKYGPVVRIAPDELITISPDAWKDVYTRKPQMTKDPFSMTPPLNGAESLFTATGDTHVRIRRNFANGFSDKALRKQSKIIEGYIELLLQRLRRVTTKSASGEVDLAKFFGYLSLDIYADLMFGESFHGLEGDNEHSWILGFFLGAKFGSVRNSIQRFHPLEVIFGWIFLRLTSKMRVHNWKVATDRITYRLEMGDLGSERSDFVSPIIGNVNEGNGITRKELNTNGLAIVIAGCQLPTVALATSCYFLMKYPETLAILTEEVRSCYSEDKEIDVQSTIGLPYLEAVINETLRIHHPTPNQLPRNVPPEGAAIAGNWIPGGTIIGVAMQAAQTSPLNFFEPKVFHPERFLPESHPLYDSRFATDNREAFKPFSTGPRSCMGGKTFLAQARVTLARMVWNFEMELGNKNDGNWIDQRAYLVFEPKALHVRLKERCV